MGGVGAVGSYKQSAFVVQVADGAFDDPAFFAQAAAVIGLAARDHGFYAAFPDQAAVLVVVIAAVGDQPIGPVSGPSRPATDGWDGIQERQELGNVVAVGRGR